jgi:hypothetical protein
VRDAQSDTPLTQYESFTRARVDGYQFSSGAVSEPMALRCGTVKPRALSTAAASDCDSRWLSPIWPESIGFVVQSSHSSWAK